MLSVVGIGSWNVRGLGDPDKRTAVLSELEAQGVDLICLQETHLSNETRTRFGGRKFQTQFHSVYSSYSRGVSILIKKGVSFTCRGVQIDTLGCYIFLHCLLDGREFVIANIYILPPSKLEILYYLLEYMENKTGIPLILVGDFNTVLDSRQDRLPSGTRTGRAMEGRLKQFLEKVGWCDLWRIRNPNVRQYSCYSGTHYTLSRIDLAIGNKEAHPLVHKIDYGPRGLSDH